MHQKFNISTFKIAKPSQSTALVIVFVTLFLICLGYNLFLFNHKPHYTNTPLSLPDATQHQNNVEPELILEKQDESEIIEQAKKPNKPIEQAKTEKKDPWTVITTRPGDSLAAVFKRLNISQQTLLTLVRDKTYGKKLAGIKPNQQIKFLIKNNVLEQMVLALNPIQTLTISRQGTQYVNKITSREMDSHHQFLTATIQGSLYGTAQRLKLPYKLVQQMTEIFNWEIDFAKDIRAGDQFSILYNALYIDDKWVSTGDILAVTYTNRGKVHQAIRHESASGAHDYYTPQGISLKKAFSRYPIKFSHISSTFSLSRKHPILHYSRPHKGVDLAAPLGTPIHATGDGYIQMIGHQNDYGNMVKVAHNKTYSSIYGHLLRFQKGLTKGAYVKRGQVIGYVGQTGLATGPHCHYEFHINQQPKNPSTIELPRSSPVPAREIAAFKAKAGTALARLKLYESGHLASHSVKKSSKTG